MSEGPKKPVDLTLNTCMKWGADGSLSPHDQDGLIRHLCFADPALAATEVCEIYINDS